MIDFKDGKHEANNQNNNLPSVLVVELEPDPEVGTFTGALDEGALVLDVEGCAALSVCWTSDWFRKAIFEALIRAAGPSSDGQGDMQGVEQ